MSDTKTPIELTANQMRIFNEIEADKVGVDATFKAAMNFHSNNINAISKREREHWNEVLSIHKLPRSKEYVIKYIDGVQQVVEVPNEDKQ